MEPLKLSKNRIERPGPLVLVVMDGVGLNPNPAGNAFAAARTPILTLLFETCPNISLRAHGRAVGLPSDSDMGNSEVGHNAMGAGRKFNQGAMLVSDAISSGRLFRGSTWKKLIGNCLSKHSTLHFMGLLSDGNVHSHIEHLYAILRKAADEGVKKVRVHILLDGRDVGGTSALEYVRPLEALLQELNENGCDFAVASGGGRMLVTMDRYGADWDIVKRGWDTHVLGKAEAFSSAEEAILTFRERKPGIVDQFLPPFVVHRGGKPVGPIRNGDSVILFNYRGDRAIEISRAFEDIEFHFFDRGKRPDVEYAGMMEYDGDCHIPRQFLVPPPAISRTMGEYLAVTGISQMACSETQKYGHLTYFWNGNRSGKFSRELETYIEIPSDKVPFEQRPWMKSAEITDTAIEAIESGRHRFIRLNYANGDMVGHTGVFDAAVIAVEAVDLALGRLLKAVQTASGVTLITSDHGNVDEMFEMDGKGNPVKDENGNPVPKTSHTLNPVPCILCDPGFKNEYRLKKMENAGLSNLAATCFSLLGFEAPADYDESLIEWMNAKPAKARRNAPGKTREVR